MKPTVIVLFIFSVFHLTAQIVIENGSSFKYFKGSAEPSSGDEWLFPVFNDINWQEGNTPFWYGDGINGTLLEDMQNKYSSIYLRKKIMLESVSNLESISIFVNYDDGFKLYINGKLLINENAPVLAKYNSYALAQHESGDFENYSFNLDESLLQAGENVIAIQVFNANLSSSDLHFDMSLKLVQVEPQSPRTNEVEISVPGGFFYQPFTSTIKAGTDGDIIRYTLDCSDPETSPNALEGVSPVQVLIDPDNIVNRPKTPTVILRACAVSPTLAPSFSRTVSYIFPEKVKMQTYPGGSWPSTAVNSQVFDYEMDPDVVNNPNYKSQMDLSLTDIPSVSLVSSADNLIDPAYGIYVNAGVRGDDWERPGSLELIDSKGNEAGFQVNAGIRIRGGWSRHPNNPKHAFRLFFRSEYGDSKLKYPLFGEEGTDEFDKLDLRTSQNYSWSYKGDPLCTMNRDVFSRDLQREMNQPYTRSRYYHLYLNGMYWGLYQSQERAESRYAESYFGGDADEYDVVKVNTQNYSQRSIEATDGNLDAWKEIYDFCLQGFSNDKNYFQLQGRNATGEIDSSKQVLVDIDNLIDYMLVIFYTGNIDAPYSDFTGGINNFFNIRNRTFRRQGFQFFAHDAEHTLLPGRINEDRVNLKVNFPKFEQFQAQSLHLKLTENALYRRRFADRAYKYLYNDGLLTPAKCRQIFQSRVNEIQYAIIAESARWGDSKVSIPFTKSDWQNSVEDVKANFFEKRSDILISQLKNAGLLPSIPAPEYIIEGNTLTIENPGNSGTVFYTLNGEDPIGIDETRNPAAFSFAVQRKEINLTGSLEVKARIIDNYEMSPLRTGFILNDPGIENLKVTEIHYNPNDKAGKSGKHFEFVELKNVGSNCLNVSDLKVNGGIHFFVKDPTVLQPNEFLVLASNPYLFEYAYQKSASGSFTGHLSNDGDELIIQNGNNPPICQFKYGVITPWPLANEMAGYSLVQLNGLLPEDGWNWVKSSVLGGTPFMEDYAAIRTELSPVTHTLNDPFSIQLSSDYLAINTLIDREEVSVEIFDIQGRLIFLKTGINISAENSFVIPTFDLKLKKGIYLIRIHTTKCQMVTKLYVK